MVKALIFDCFGVLTTDIWLAFCESLPEGANVEAARDLNKAFDRGMITHEQFISGVQEVTGYTPPDIEAMYGGEVVKNQNLLDMIKELKDDYAIALLSNISSDWITREFLSSEEQELFDAMIFSYEVGITKPDPRMYMLACERLRVGPHEAVMIDDRRGYVEAAEAEGLQGIVYSDMPTFTKDLRALLDTNN